MSEAATARFGRVLRRFGAILTLTAAVGWVIPVMGQAPATVELSLNADLLSGLDPSHIWSLAAQKDGHILVAGFLRSTSALHNGYLARVNPSGSIDSSFNPALEGIQNLRVTLQKDQQILIGGKFRYDLGGVMRSNVVRLHPDGSVDLSFDPGLGPDDIVYAVLELADGRILVGGDFRSFGGAQRRGLARLNHDGSVDSDFHSLPWATSSVKSLALTQQGGQILILGTFMVDAIQMLPGIARLHPDGSVDSAFAPTEMWVNCPAFAPRPDGTVLLATGRSDENSLVLLNPDGSRNTNFAASVSGGTSSINPPGVQALVLQADGRVVIGGKFTKVNNVARAHIARLEPDGQLDTTFNAGAGPVRPGDTMSYMVSALAVLKDGHLLVAGPFTKFSGHTRGGMVKLLGDPLPRFATPTVFGGRFLAQITANLGDVVDLFTASELGSWTPWITLTNHTGSVSVSDPIEGRRFYRAVTR